MIYGEKSFTVCFNDVIPFQNEIDLYYGSGIATSFPQIIAYVGLVTETAEKFG